MKGSGETVRFPDEGAPMQHSGDKRGPRVKQGFPRAPEPKAE
jgi:hypothetical protein